MFRPHRPSNPSHRKTPFRVRVRFHPIPSTLPLRPSLILHNPQIVMNPTSAIVVLRMSHPLRFLRSPHLPRVRRLLVLLSLAGSSIAPGLARADSKPIDPPRFELRGILDFGGGRSFSLHDLRTGATFWIEANRTIDGYRIVNYDSTSKTLTLASEAETLRIRLQKADETPIEIIQSTASANLAKPEPKRPPRPKLSRAKSVERSSGLKPNTRKGVLNAELDPVLPSSAGFSGQGEKSAVETEAVPETLQAKLPERQPVEGQLTYELKVRPPLRIGSIGRR